MVYWVRAKERDRDREEIEVPTRQSMDNVPCICINVHSTKKFSGCGTVLRSGADPFGMKPPPGCRHRIEVWGPATGELGEAPPRVQRLLAALSPPSLPLSRSPHGWLFAAKPTWGHHPSSFSSMREILLARSPPRSETLSLRLTTLHGACATKRRRPRPNRRDAPMIGVAS